MPNHIVLYQPEIPSNTANIARTCVGTNTALHFIRPLGFSTDEKMLKRAGLDFWHAIDVHYHDSFDDFFQSYPKGNYYFIETFGEKSYTDFDFSEGSKEVFFIFGRETTGIPMEIIEKNKENCLRIPMTSNVRSLNLSNTAAILIYEALRQQNFSGLSPSA